jgi:hypothetical protein
MRTVLVAVFVLALGAIGSAATTIPAGTKILCVLKHGIKSTTAMVGNDFSLVVDDPAQPALEGASVHGSVTDVGRSGGTARARIGFILTYIKFRNGTRAAVHADVVGKDVVQTNTAVAAREAVKFSLPQMPSGAVTPGPIVWQIHFRQNEAPSVSPPPAGNTSGYVYAKKSNENIVIPPGSPVTIQLTSDLTAP